MAQNSRPCSCIYARRARLGMGESQRVRMDIYARLHTDTVGTYAS